MITSALLLNIAIAVQPCSVTAPGETHPAFSPALPAPEKPGAARPRCQGGDCGPVKERLDRKPQSS